MVKEVERNNLEYYYCEGCKLLYEKKDRKWAEECEKWCEEHDSCNFAITQHSIKKTLEDIK